jgi:hypothetical protein
MASFRVEFGITDTEPRAWDGSLSATGGEVGAIRLWRDRPGYEVAAISWKLGTTKPEHQRPWRFLPSRSVLPMIPGLIVDAKGSAEPAFEYRQCG